jgi:hypothetical protein
MSYTMNTIDFTNYFDFTRINDDEYLKEKFLKKYKKDKYIILKYDKNYLNIDNIDSLGKFRSIIYNTETNQIVSCSPFKSYSLEQFTNKYDNISCEDKKITFEEFVEGSMVNLFYDNEEWQIATRTILGGKNAFFKGGKTFRQMFLECMNEKDVEFDELDKQYSYSFIIQHSDNRIVTKFNKPNPVLCAVFKCQDTCVTELPFQHFDIVKKIQTPKVYELTSFDEAIQVYANPQKTPYYIQGIVFKYNNMRGKVRNPNYEYVRQLRGNQSKTQFQYLSLRTQGLVKEFLKYYPEYNDEFKNYRTQVHEFTKQLHVNYINCYVKKQKPLCEYPREYRQHMYTLHQKYIQDLIPIKKYITYEFVVQYINTMNPAHLMYAINFKYRNIKSEIHQECLEECDETIV